MAGFNIEAFKAVTTAKGGFMRNNRFLMTFPMPQTMLDHMDVGRTIEFWGENVNLPGYQLVTHDVRRWTYGPIEKRPFAPNFTPLQCTFLIDNDSEILRFFNNWMQSIMPHDTEAGMNNGSNYGGLPYELKYKEQYVTDLNIYTYSETGEPVLNIVCKEAFPSHVVDIPLSWEDTNNIAKLQVTFDYLDWYSKSIVD